jgi:glycosyltransferase involved in cell wall biosynthesis
MTGTAPPLSIGLPVKNGAGFLTSALDSLLSQSYGDFDLLVADNDSTDETEDIVREYARRDSRVTYHRHARDIGANANFNYVVRNTRGQLFKWAAADDLQHETFLRRCVDVHAADPSIAAVCTAIEHIDEEGRSLGVAQDLSSASSAEPAARFADFIRYDYSCAVSFGLLRRDLIENTRLLLPFWGSDRVFLAELALAGRIVVIDEPLFYEREHANKLSNQVARREVGGFHRTRGYGSRFLTWRHGTELVRAVRLADLDPAQQRRTYAVLCRWAIRNRVKFARSLARGVMETALIPLIRR